MGEAGLAFRALLDSAGGFWVGSDILVYDLKEPLMDSLHGEGIEEDAGGASWGGVEQQALSLWHVKPRVLSSLVCKCGVQGAVWLEV